MKGHDKAPRGCRRIGAFIEKPDAPTAEGYLASGDHLWNSGIFMLRASVWMAQLGALRSDIVKACTAAFAARGQDRDFLRVETQAFAAANHPRPRQRRTGQSSGCANKLASIFAEAGNYPEYNSAP